MSTAVAAIAFPAMKALDVRIPGLALDDRHYRFVAGELAQRTFLVADIVSFACAIAAGASMLALIVAGKAGVRGVNAIVRALGLSVALAGLGAMLFIITPQINAASRLHMAAAKAGDAAAALAHAKAVDDLHPIASTLMLVQIVGVLAALFGGAWSVARSSGPSLAAPGSPYPSPALLKSRR